MNVSFQAEYSCVCVYVCVLYASDACAIFDVRNTFIDSNYDIDRVWMEADGFSIWHKNDIFMLSINLI